MSAPLSRRHFNQMAASAAALGVLPGRLPGANERVNVAIIGCGGMGGGDGMAVFRTGLVNVVALCDVALGTPHTAGLEKEFPDVPRYKDFRVMFDKMEKEIDAVNIFQATMLAMTRCVRDVVAQLEMPPEIVLIDGNMTPQGRCGEWCCLPFPAAR